MYFLVNTLTQQITAHNKLGDAARSALVALGAPNNAADPIAAFNDSKLNETYVLLNLSDAFESISESDDTAAQELAASYKQAIDNFYA
tara:strand:+ start:1898 stop:2161 length:264 start_codon:yes stop_codon:yes gene_type:complete